MAPQRGVTRVTDITALDRIGIPVFSSIRPSATEGSLCVSAGKGLAPDEARIGAYMEAIELSFAEYSGSHVDFTIVRASEMLASFENTLQFSDFSPLMGTRLEFDEEIAVVEAELVGRDRRVLIPAELVFLPFFNNPGEQKFGTSSVGLASGNNVMEATVHALAEIIEHDIASFDFIRDNSALVDMESAPPNVRSLVIAMEKANFQVYLRYTKNNFGLPYFRAVLFDNSDHAAVA
ncbi:MAG: YcaO-like family protein, partial [Rectinemataceae bacterium]|nr:YcaO-like family protein [Rectinemataceae bacterium]